MACPIWKITKKQNNGSKMELVGSYIPTIRYKTLENFIKKYKGTSLETSPWTNQSQGAGLDHTKIFHETGREYGIWTRTVQNLRRDCEEDWNILEWGLQSPMEFI